MNRFHLIALPCGVLLAAAVLFAQAPADTWETKTEIRIAVKADPNAEKPVRFAIAKVQKDGKEVPTPKGIALDVDKGEVTWTPTPSQAGAYEVTVSAKDAKNQETVTALKINVKPRAITSQKNEIGNLLTKWHAEGTAAGNTGDWYDNRDGEHSPLNLDPWPQLDKVPYTDQERKARVDWAAQRVILKQVVFGNSSTSAAPTGGGSNVRSYYANPRGVAFLHDQYRNNNVYIYPEHRDHDPRSKGGDPGYGDLYMTNTPYILTSQGSSGSDQPFMRVLPYTLAAFRPEVKQKLVENGLLMPTLQMLLRSTNKNLKEPGEYLTGKAHPTVFEGSWVNDVGMVKAAHDLTLDTIPPLAQLKVVEEDSATPGKDFFEPQVDGSPWLTEKLHDTPGVIARVVRGPQHVRRLVVSAEGSVDVNKKPLKYHWSVLRGDGKRITIKPLNEAGSVVEIQVPYHARFTAGPVPIETNRVDIGAFVHNGANYSAPAFVTFYSLDNEARTYDAKGRLLEIGHGVGDADFNVSDWNGLFALIQGEAKELPAKLLHGQLKEAERTELAKAGVEYKAATEKQVAVQDTHKKAVEVRNKALAALKTADDKVKTAKKAFDDDGSDANFAAVKKAIEEQQALEAERKTAEADYQAAEKANQAASKTVSDILGVKRPGLDAPIRTIVDGALCRLRDQPGFALEHCTALEAALAAADPAAKARVAAAQKRIVNLGVLKPEANGFTLRSIRAGDRPVAERLTGYERDALARYHAELLSSLVYPKLVSVTFRPNFVDQRLTTPKSWRDVYRYDDARHCVGWLRNDGATEVEFNADGHAILEKDARGRPVKARSMRYELDPVQLKANVRVVKPTWGDRVLHYEYANDQDTKGKIAREEKVEAK